jgi:hypothetical protein
MASWAAAPAFATQVLHRVEAILGDVSGIAAQVRHRVERIRGGMPGFLEEAELRLLGAEFQVAKLCASIAATSTRCNTWASASSPHHRKAG